MPTRTPTLTRSGPLWHLIERPRAPFVCDVCGVAIPDDQWGSFTTLPNMYYDTPPAGHVPCNRDAVALDARYPNAVAPGPEPGGEPSKDPAP